ncbi:MAG TPA: 3-hydroxybutyrate dehydrogenase [Alphaproteobacteria bacterium]|nr:3-hydroxybutyrate dehydrogenase [Alphaproteobacteria bacterium]
MLKGKSAIVTGSTSGIGHGIARALAAQGCNIMLNGFADADTVAKVKKEIADFGVRVEFNPADVGKPEQIDQMIDATAKAFGSVDIIVNNAGIQFVAPIEKFPVEKWDAIIATNLSSCFYTMRRAVPLMRDKGWGRMINIASAHGLVASADKAAYVAAKHGVVGLTKVVALETAGSGVTCNAICPGWVLTPLVQKQIDAIASADKLTNEQASKKLLGEKQPSLQFVTPEEIGGLAVFLCSETAKQITGAHYSIDGGWTAQ